MRTKHTETSHFKHTWEYSGSLEELSSFLNNFTALRYASMTSSLALSKPQEGYFKHEKSHIKKPNKTKHTIHRNEDCFKHIIQSTFFQGIPLPYPGLYELFRNDTLIRILFNLFFFKVNFSSYIKKQNKLFQLQQF